MNNKKKAEMRRRQRALQPANLLLEMVTALEGIVLSGGVHAGQRVKFRGEPNPLPSAGQHVSCRLVDVVLLGDGADLTAT